MGNSYYALESVLDIPKWEHIQDWLAIITKMAIITVDYKGIPITKHSYCCDFCQSVRADPNLEKICQTCDSRAGLEAIRSHAPYIYLCHFNIIDIAIPIVMDDKYIGAVIAGQIKMNGSSASTKPIEHILPSRKNKYSIRHLRENKEAYLKIPVLIPDEVQKYALFLSSICSYIVETTLEKNKIIQTYETILEHSANINVSLPERAVKRTSDFYPLTAAKKQCSTAMLEPVFEYVHNHIDEPINQVQMAELLHLSPSYFSRLFVRKTGESFTQYLAHERLEYAKQLLEKTDDSIVQISEKLAFNSPGYFSTFFKKFEGITPLQYRKYYHSV